MPMFLDPPAKVTPAYESGFVVVGPVIRRTGMRNINRDHWNAGLAILCGDNGGHRFVSLELNGKIYFLAHQQVRVSLCDLGVITVIQRDEFDTFGLSRPLQAARDLARKLIVGSLGSVAQSTQALL